MPLRLLSFLFAVCAAFPVFANGRQPCDRGAGGVAWCAGAKFVCNNGKISGSKRRCDPDVYGARGKTHGGGVKRGAGKSISTERGSALIRKDIE
jgi:hypothetical protein